MHNRVQLLLCVWQRYKRWQLLRIYGTLFYLMRVSKSTGLKALPTHVPTRLEDLPNIGKKLAADLRSVGIHKPEELRSRDPKTLFVELAPVMGHRHDPCVLYTLLAVKHFLEQAESLPWWEFTAKGKEIMGTRNA